MREIQGNGVLLFRERERERIGDEGDEGDEEKERERGRERKQIRNKPKKPKKYKILKTFSKSIFGAAQ